MFGLLNAIIAVVAVAIIMLAHLAVDSARAISQPDNQQQHAAQGAPEQKPVQVAEVPADQEIAEYTLWLTVFTAVLAVSTIGLWWTTRNAAITQACDMEKSVAAAERAANVAERSLRELNRAFVFPAGVSFRSNPITPDDTDVIVTWENSGTTQTKALRSRINWASFPPHKLDGFDFPDVGAEAESRSYIGPKSILNMAPMPIPQANIASAGGRTSRLLVWGWAEYDDIFQDTVRHRTEF